MSDADSIIRLFVSSTFADFDAERRALHTSVFPQLRELCAQRGVRFQAIDLRWGVSAEAAQQQDTMRICLAEVERCRQTGSRPHILILLGQRYGWQPLPDSIPAEEFEQMRPHFQATLPEDWYREDRNAVPPAYLLQPRTEPCKDYRRWEPVEQRLKEILRTATEQIGLCGEARLKYHASATDQEIEFGCLRQELRPGEVVACLRTIRGLPDDGRARLFVDRDEAGKPNPRACRQLADLCERVRAKLGADLWEYEAAWTGRQLSQAHLDGFCGEIQRRLSGIILSELDARAQAGPAEREWQAHLRFATEQSRLHIGRQALIDRIRSYLRNESAQPLLVTGPEGSGKSALLSCMVREATASGVVVAARFLGVTPESSNGVTLLSSLGREIEQAYGALRSAHPVRYEDALTLFQERLRWAHRERPITLLIDAVDQLAAGDPARDFAWIPRRLPPYVKFVVSAASETAAGLDGFIPKENRLSIEDMPREEAILLLRSWLAETGRRLNPEQEDYLLDRFEKTPLPLYLRMAFEHARHWTSWEPPHALQGDVTGIAGDVLRRLKSDHGEVLVGRTLAYLAAARHGLTEDECLDLLSRDADVLSEFRRRSPQSPPSETLPVVIWSRLRYDAAPYLSERSADGTQVLSFFHRQIERVVREEYLGGEEGTRRHDHLARYFKTASSSRPVPPLRALSELPFQQARARQWEEFTRTLTDYRFLRAKIGSFGPERLIRDYDLVTSCPDPAARTLRHVQKCLEISAHVLTRSPAQLAGQLLGRLLEEDTPEYKVLLDQATRNADVPALLPRTGSLGSRDDELLRTLHGHTDNVNALAPIPGSERIVSASSDGTLRLWDLQHWLQARLLHAHSAPVRAVAVTPDGSRAVSASEDRTLKIWDLHDGSLLHCLDEHEDQVVAVAVSEDGEYAVSGSADRTLRVWRISDGILVRTIQAHDAPVRGVAAVPGGEWIVSVSEDRRLRVWNLKTGRLMWSGEHAHSRPIIAVGVSSDGRLAATASEDQSVVLWALKERRPVQRLLGHRGPVASALFTENGEVITASFDTTVKVWKEHSGECRETFSGHLGWVTALAILPAMGLILSGADDRTIRAWAWPRPTFRRTLVAAETKGRLAATAGAHSAIRVWDLKQGAERFRFEGVGGDVTAVAFAENPNQLFCSYRSGAIRWWDLRRGCEAGSWPAQDAAILGLAVTPKLVLTRTEDGRLTVRDRSSGRLVRQLGEAGVTAFAVVECNACVAAGANDGRIRIWDPEKGTVLQEFVGANRRITLLAAHKTRARIALASENDMVRIWAVEGQPEEIVSLPLSKVTALAMLDDPPALASLESNGTVRFWNEETGQEQAVFRFVPGSGSSIRPARGPVIRNLSGRPATDLCTTERATRLVLVARDGAVSICNSSTRPEPINRHMDQITAVATLAGSNQVLSASLDGSIRIWHAADTRLASSFRVEHSISDVAILPGDGRVAIAGGGGRLRLYDPARGLKLKEFSPHIETVVHLAALDGSRLVSSSQEGTIRIWDLEAAADVAQFVCPEDSSQELSVCPFFNLVVSGGRHLAAWSIQENSRMWSATPPGRVAGLAFQRDGRTVVAACLDDSLREYDAFTGRELRSHSLPVGSAGPFRISRDGRLVLMAGMDFTLRVLDLANCSECAGFTADHFITALTWEEEHSTCFAGDRSGRMHFLMLKGLD